MATKHLLRITTSGLVLILLIGTFIEDFAQTKKKRPVYYSVYANHVMRVRLMMNWIRKRHESATLSLQLSSIRSTRRMAF